MLDPREQQRATDQPPTCALNRILLQAQSHRTALNVIHEHIGAMLDRVFGESPLSGNKPTALRAIQGPGGIVGQIADVQADIADRNSDITEMLAKLETIA